MSTENMREVLDNLKGGSVKLRQEALASVREFFSSDRVVSNWHINLDGKPEPKQWLPVFQALFTAVLTEKDALTKKLKSKTSSSTTTIEKRFTEATSVVRWLTDRASAFLNKKVVNALLEHLLQTIINGGQFRSLFALDYIKALVSLASYSPHLNWIEEDMWVRLIQLGFNFVLEDPLRAKFEDDQEEAYNPPIKVEADDAHMYDDDEMVTDGEPSSRKHRKRNRSNSDPFTQPSSQRRQERKRPIVSKEQLECMSLLSILFRSPSVPLLSTEYLYLPSSILGRMKRFLDIYSADTSLLHDYVLILSSILPSLSLNRIREVRSFAPQCWRSLIRLWGSKSKRVKEGLIIILHLLFPFIAEDSNELDRTSMLYDLASLLDKEVESKGMGEGLNLDCLRLELPEAHSEQHLRENTAFTASTYRAGSSFDPTHAITWAIFSLHSDCIAKLHHVSESSHTQSSPVAPTRRGKRARLDLQNPITSLLASIKDHGATNTRCCFLQTLLFFISSHWGILHRALKGDAVDTLLQLVSVDDTKVQSWIFLCFAAIADAETRDRQTRRKPATEAGEGNNSWDSVWTNSIRRANTPAVCRAACHAAHAILLHMQASSRGITALPISQQRVLSEIESMIKDLDVQGPPIPHDSICAFLKSCLQVSSQDMRMYRLHLEDKVLSWLIDCWKPVDVTKKVPSSITIHDFTALLATICSFPRQCSLISHRSLPSSPVAQVLYDEAESATIKDFLLHAKLPEPRPMEKEQSRMEFKTLQPTQSGLMEQKGKERRISAFTMKALEETLMRWDEGYSPVADTARKCIDLAVITISFQALLVLNGTQSDRRVIRSACNMIKKLTTQLLTDHWTTAEKAFIISGFNPLSTTEPRPGSEAHWEALASPDIGSGIKSSTLQITEGTPAPQGSDHDVLRVSLLRIIWQNSDIQDAFTQVSSNVWDVLRISIHANPDSRGSDDRDGFGTISTNKSVTGLGLPDASSSQVTLIDSCVRFLAVGSTLQSTSGEPLHKKELVDVFLSCAENSTDLFFLVFPSLLRIVQQGYLHFSAANLGDALDSLEPVLTQYMFSFTKNSTAQLLVIHLFTCTLGIWGPKDTTIHPGTLSKIQILCHLLAQELRNEGIRHWSVRDAIARFIAKYLDQNPSETTWCEGDLESDESAMELLCLFGADSDVRVRFRAAFLCTRLFAHARKTSESPSSIYTKILRHLTQDAADYERVLTRMLLLGNVMIVSSETRRGPYWHLLETCIYTNNEQTPINYETHIHAVLRAVAQSLGFSSLSLLFEAYAAQLAFSICQVGAQTSGESNGPITSIVQFPYRILGYENRLQSALATFRFFSPTNIWNNGQKQFIDHCKAVGKTREQGIMSCFGDIVGYEITRWIQSNGEPGELADHLRSRTVPGDEFDTCLEENVDSIVVFILHTLGDQDVSEDGPYFSSLKAIGNDTAVFRTFRDLTRFRDSLGFAPHPPNLPTYPVPVILAALDWLRYHINSVDAPSTTYHVLQQLFAQVEQSSLINEQLRLINAISLWVALHHSDFDDQTLLLSLIRGSTSLFQQIDLRKACQSILDWCFARFRKIGSTHSMLSDTLLRLACTANERIKLPAEVDIQMAGREILAWIDDQVFRFSQIPALAVETNKALSAWPHQPVAPLDETYHAITSEDISSALRGLRTSTNRFRLVSRLEQYTEIGGYDISSFVSLDFWRLKRCIPLVGELDTVDVDAFLDLLFLSKGNFNGLANEQDQTSVLSRRKQIAAAMQAVASKEQETKRRQSKATGVQATKDGETAMCSIILILLGRLHGDSAHHTDAAYQTLRQISTLSEAGRWIPEHAAELRFLAQRHYQEPIDSNDRSLQELQSDDCITIASDSARWTTWITTLLAEILSAVENFYHCLISTLKSDVEFAGDILPVLIHILLRAEQQSQDPHPNRQLLSQYFTSLLQSPAADVDCSRLIINTVLHLRNFSPLAPVDALSYNSWLDIDPLLLARKAIACGMYTSAILFLELANEQFSKADVLGDSEDIMYQIYQHIDEPDGFYGISYKDPHRNLMKRFEHEKQWDRAFRFHGAALEAGDIQEDHSNGLVQSFHAIGLNQLANDVLQGLSSFSKQSTSGINYRLHWRTETWDLPDFDGHQGGAPLYLALRAIHRERDESIVDNQIRKGIATEMNHLRGLGTENFTEIRETVQELLCLGEVARWRSILPNTTGGQYAPLQALVKIDSTFDFPVAESVLSTRMSILHAARSKAERQQIGTLQSPLTRTLLEAEKRCVLDLSGTARTADQEQIALNSIIRAQKLEKSPSLAVFEEFANVLWCQKEEKSAVEYLDRLCSNENKIQIQEPIPPTRMALILARLGSWSSQACLKKPNEIQQDYFQRAADLLKNSTSDAEDPEAQNSSAEIYYQYAIFAEQQYHSINNSPDVLRWKIYRDRKLQEIEAGKRDLLNLQPGTKPFLSLEGELAKLQKLYNEDVHLYTTHHTSLDIFLKGAIEMYSRCLYASDDYDQDAATRLCSLWFANFHTEDIQEHIAKALERVPSHKFILLSHQLSARMSTLVEQGVRKEKPRCQENLQTLIQRMCREHPFHSLYQVYSLKGDDQSSGILRSMAQVQGKPQVVSGQNERKLAAADIFDQLRSEPATAARVKNIERLSLASMKWAKYKIDPKAKQHLIPDTLDLIRIKGIPVPIMTSQLSVDRTLQYDNLCTIVRFRSTFKLCGGNTWPKVTICIGSDGKSYQQLFKGDDLRQDAVMEQVFGLVNAVLERDRQTKRRNLSIRQYKVIPLEAQSGVLEFVENTSPLKGWLDDAHRRYHPKDLRPSETYELIQTNQRKYGDTERLYEEFEVLKQRIRPVMRHYFTEKHKVPISWFAMRLNYTRSVATTSIVGHVLGLGDRHTSNILIDNVSGDVVHIDLGIAFDQASSLSPVDLSASNFVQGKVLPVPELVPFRMTRDMVDGMGMAGTSGVFHRCAEETLRVIRDGSGLLMTVLEVFKHDPLHNWTVDKIKVQRIQQVSAASETIQRPGSTIGIDMSSGKAEEAADRALNSVARKLDKSMSVQYIVNQLIREATDVRNLARIFKGWNALL